MNFAPLHKFGECRRLERVIDDLENQGYVPSNIYEFYNTYHFSLIHKLRSAKSHIDLLENYLASQNTHSEDATEVVYTVNFHFDGFTHNLGSSMDIFAREILNYYNLPLTGNIYFHTASPTIAAIRTGDPILSYLRDPTWKQEFSDYRNTATHENIVSFRYQIDVVMRGSIESRRMVIPLPDNPRSPESARLYNRNPDILIYCKRTFTRIVSIFNCTYRILNSSIQRNGRLPL